MYFSNLYNYYKSSPTKNYKPYKPLLFQAIEHNGYEGDVNLGLDLEKINKIPD